MIFPTLAELRDFVSHLRGRRPGAPDYERPKHGWTCFHCGETFKTAWGARVHFGTPGDKTKCQTDGRP